MDLSAISRFTGKDGTQFKLTKLSSKRPNSAIDVGQSRVGYLSLFKYVPTKTLPEATGLMVGSLRTSPIVKVVDFGQDFTLFETEGGVYKVEEIIDEAPKGEKRMDDQ